VMAKGRLTNVLTKEELDDESKVFAALAQ
jgi:hypothetical protein